MRLDRSFYLRDTVIVAKSLLGKRIVRKFDDYTLSAMIVETEAYLGKNDTACHASKGKTQRTKVMFGDAGYSYVYMIYGMYYMLNIVTEKIGNPCAVLIRAVEPVDNILIMEKFRKTKGKNLTNGPGKLCQALKIDKSLNAENLILSNSLWLEKHIEITDSEICKGKRIGIDYSAEKDRESLLRFWIKDNIFVSKT